ncbi:hypothetical protein K458DRAFT_485151 [Lentithecium fluviatile CBS 122367]|uniref:Extracellular membrane protein CFEM domain-containing protein n=1 Tax=Lentithecium fluviatile CBS 122367 TaxID=1168545 RepID=A0A6G1JBQ1_9PLEO|nr:hypothetical protein K458DRAFT_485151 [Lentithecium fluviatile CBS 122367]
MVMYSVATSMLALSGAVSAIQLNQPRATPVNKNYPANGWTPKPTTKPRPLLELFRRQEDPAFCGYLDGDGDFPITCDPGSSCLMDDVFSWFGCCTGSAITDCEVATACVRSAAYDDCLSDSSCANDPLAMVCTSADEPFCAWLYTTYSGSSYGHFVCAESSTSFAVVSTTSGGSDPTFTLETTSSAGPSILDTSTSRVRSSTSEVDDTTESETSTRTTRERTSTSDATTTTTQPPPSRVAVPSTTTAGAVRTAEAVAGAVGGVAGMIALLL